MSRRIIPLAEAAGARFLPNCRAVVLLRRHGRVTGVLVRIRRDDGSQQLVRIDADQIFVCCGPTETPALLQRSAIRYHVGNTLCIHPYLKVAAKFDQPVDAERSVLPLLQAKFTSDLSLGGSFFTTGHVAMTLSENWPQNKEEMKHVRHMAHFYVGVRGSGQGSVRPTLFGQDSTLLRYELSEIDNYNLSVGLARMATCLLAAGAKAVFPSVYGIPSIRTEAEAIRWLDQPLPKSALSLVTVHVFSTCPAGERRDRCAVNSFGRVNGFANLYLNDASILPDSPGVNPQGTVMAMARRNAQRFAAGE